MLYLTEPNVFKSKFDVVGCICEHKGKVLLLLRQDHKPQGNMWGLPSGKVDEGESLEQAVVRELFEESGIQAEQSKIKYFKKTFVKYPNYDFIYHLFVVNTDKINEIKINPAEHKDYKWIKLLDVMKLENGMEDLGACIKLYL